ncbi:MAG: hypothetical protein GXO45_00275 [Aquificae bacterium]|nr:hypothetical protein [Aquificota bacterium]
MAEKKAYPFALVGFFVSDRDINETFRHDVSPEEIEKVRQLIKELFFTEGVDVAIAPFLVPPDQVEDALNELAEVVFTPPEEKEN